VADVASYVKYGPLDVYHNKLKKCKLILD